MDFIPGRKMSRSYKKPIINICHPDRKRLSWCKKKMTRKTRRSLNETEDPINNSGHRKLVSSWDWDPREAKSYYPEDPKSYRK
jgi:hypothetical protein